MNFDSLNPTELQAKILDLSVENSKLQETLLETERLQAIYYSSALDAAKAHDASFKEREALALENGLCREAVESAVSFVEGCLKEPLDDMSEGAGRATLRQLHEAIGKACPRLLYENPKGQKLYALHTQDLLKKAKDQAFSKGWKAAMESIWNRLPLPCYQNDPMTPKEIARLVEYIQSQRKNPTPQQTL